MNGNKAVPNIRFNGFKDEFKVGKLENFFDIKDGTHSSPQYINSGFPLVTSKNLTESGLKLENASYISKSDFDEINKRSKVDVGDILFGMIGTIGTPVMVKENNFAIKNVALIKEYSKPKVLNIWLIYYFQSPAFDKFIHFRSAGGTQKFLALGVIQNMKFKFPLKKEQQKIGNFFAKLDKLLDLQQQKIDKLELLKKALLQGLFPKHDVKVPELRFNGYKKNWEKDLIGNVSTSKSGGTPSIAEKEYYDGNIPFIRSSDINKSRTELCINDNAVKHSSTFIVEKGSILYALYGATSGQVALSKVKGAINQAVLAIFPKNYIEKIFLMYWFIYSKKRIVSKYLQGGQGNLSAKIIKNLIFCFPNKSEQQKIGNLLSKVDQLIELENKKLQNFQQVKKCLLQNMFVE